MTRNDIMESLTNVEAALDELTADFIRLRLKIESLPDDDPRPPHPPSLMREIRNYFTGSR